MTYEELELLQSLPLDIKVAKTKQRIREAVRQFGLDGVYVSFSGGKDSTVLLHIARELYPEIKAVYCDTGLEYPEIKNFVKSFDNVDIIRPKKNFKQIIKDYGYPIISKENSRYIYEIRNSKSEKIRNLRLYGNKNGSFKLSKKWHFLLDAPFKISDNCCYHMKKSPMKKYERESGRTLMLMATLAEESRLRAQAYVRQGGCNGFHMNRPRSTPMGFWRESDVLQYIKENNIEIAPIYGEIEEVDGAFCIPRGVNRTGCIFCAFGAQLEKGENKFQLLKKSHPKLYDYCINGGCYENGEWMPDSNGLGFGKVLDYIGVPYE